MTTRIVLYARLGGRGGGRARFVKSLIRGCYEIDVSGVEYIVVTRPKFDQWANKYKDGKFDNGNVHIVSRPWHGTSERLKTAMRPIIPYIEPFVLPLLDQFRSITGDNTYSVPQLNDFFYTLDPDVIHWLARYWERSDIPMVYNLGDLQDRRYPENFDKSTRAWRDTFCQSGCQEANAIITASQFVANNIVEEYGVDREKISVIYRGPPTQYDRSSLDAKKVCERYNISPGFAFYPSRKWVHKNHKRLLQALDKIKQRHSMEIPLVCTGGQIPKKQFRKLKQQTRTSGLSDTINWLGYVDEDELLALYKASGFLIFPTLYEGQGFPLVEAFDMGTAVACSDIPPLREYGGSAPYYFNPESVTEIADAVHKLYTDDVLRSELEQASQSRSTAYTWEETARKYTQIYKLLAGHENP